MSTLADLRYRIANVRQKERNVVIMAGAFRLIVLDGATVEEEYDGLTSGGATDAAAVVNAHSRLIRIQPGAEQGVPVASRQPGSRL